MLLEACFVASLAMPAAALVPNGDAESVKWGKKDSGHVIADVGLTYEIEGPTVIVLDLRGDDSVRGKTVAVEIARDGTYVSKNSVTFKRGRGGPKEFKLAAKLAFEVAAGKHTYVLEVDTGKVAVLATTTKRLPKRFAAAAEVEVEKPAEAMAEAAPEPPPATETAAAAPPAADPPMPLEVKEADATLATIPADVGQLMGTPPPGATGSGLEAALRVAVYDFKLQDIDPKVGKVVSDSMVAEVRKLQGISAIGIDEIRDMLSHEASKQLLGCESDESCLAEIAGALGVDNLVTGVLSKVGDGHVMVVRRIDQRRAAVVGTVNRRLKAGAGQEFLLAVGPAVEELFPDRQLRPGVERGVPREVALRLDPPPLPTWSTYTVGGGAVALAVVGTVFGLLSRDKQGEYHREITRAQATVISAAGLKTIGEDAQQRATIANVGFGTAGALALSAGVMALFTDWWGYGEDSAR
ncbi:MAG: hypothetical protein V3T05_14310 [Myxococcota bacterium]